MNYFTPLLIGNYIMLFINLSGLYIGLFKVNWKEANSNLKIFPFYISLSLLQLTLAMAPLFPTGIQIFKINSLEDYSANVFVIIEFILFCYFLKTTIYSQKIRFYISFTLILFPLFCFYYWIYLKSFSKFPAIITVAEGFILIPSCLYYFIELFLRPPTLELTKESTFWIITGILAYFITIIPIYIIDEYKANSPETLNGNLLLINTLAYCLFVVFINKAFLCWKKKVKL